MCPNQQPLLSGAQRSTVSSVRAKAEMLSAMSYMRSGSNRLKAAAAGSLVQLLRSQTLTPQHLTNAYTELASACVALLQQGSEEVRYTACKPRLHACTALIGCTG